MIEFTITGEDTFVQNLRAKSDQLIEAFRQKVDWADLLIQQRAMDKVSGEVLQIRTGNLARSIVTIPATVDSGIIEGSVQAGGGVSYCAKFQEDGTQGPYEIVATNAKALRFILNGAVMFRKSVVHPGLAAKKFMATSVEELEPQILEGLQATVGEVAAL